MNEDDSQLSRWALWRLACRHRTIGASDVHLGTGSLYCPICVRPSAVCERTAWVIRIPQDERLRVP